MGDIAQYLPPDVFVNVPGLQGDLCRETDALDVVFRASDCDGTLGKHPKKFKGDRGGGAPYLVCSPCHKRSMALRRSQWSSRSCT